MQYVCCEILGLYFSHNLENIEKQCLMVHIGRYNFSKPVSNYIIYLIKFAQFLTVFDIQTLPHN
jgi:hypothetical protein